MDSEQAELVGYFDGVPNTTSTIEELLPTTYRNDTDRDKPYGLSIDTGETLPFTLLDLELRSYSFGMALDDFFSIEGLIIELDDNKNMVKVYLGGYEGVQATVNGSPVWPVFYGHDLLADDDRILDLNFIFKPDDNIVIGADPGRIEGELRMILIVS